MCGLFGTIRPHHYDTVSRAAAAALLDLGCLAEERGTDSAGIATKHSRTLTAGPAADLVSREHIAGRWRILTTLGAFTDHLPANPRLRNTSAQRGWSWATPGGPPRVPAPSATPPPWPSATSSAPTTGTSPHRRSGWGTDSAWLFGQLDRAGTVKATTAVLTGLRGRAALAWTRQSRSGSAYLARAALSPLARDRPGVLGAARVNPFRTWECIPANH